MWAHSQGHRCREDPGATPAEVCAEQGQILPSDSGFGAPECVSRNGREVHVDYFRSWKVPGKLRYEESILLK